MRLAPRPASCRVYTSADLAEAIARALGDAPDVQWLEPSHGTGAFVKAVADLGVSKERITAVDLERVSCPADRLATTFRGIDFLRWARTSEKRFDRIIGNPPFVSIKELPPSLQKV